MGEDFIPTEGLLGALDAAGQKLFGWPTPTGHPDNSEAWLGVGNMRQRWQLASGLVENWWGSQGGKDPKKRDFSQRNPNTAFDPREALSGLPANPPVDLFVSQWALRLLGVASPALVQAIVTASGLKPGQPVANPALARKLVAWIAMAPEFQQR